MTAPIARRRDARRAWESDLTRLQLGPERLAIVQAVITTDPALAERATDAELRTPGSGAMAVAVSILKRTGAPT